LGRHARDAAHVPIENALFYGLYFIEWLASGSVPMDLLYEFHPCRQFPGMGLGAGNSASCSVSGAVSISTSIAIIRVTTNGVQTMPSNNIHPSDPDKPLPMTRKQVEGFTLIELLVVIAL